MPLIRLVHHAVNNKFHVDKMIRVEGLPEKLLYYKRDGKNFLKSPWEIDVTENIPEYIKAMHQPKPFSVHLHIPSPEKGVPPRDEEFEVYGLSLDYQNGAAEDIWLQIERIIDQNTLRGERVPRPVIVSPGIDNDHRAIGFSIKAEDIPVIFLAGFNEKKDEPKVAPVAETPKETFACLECSKDFTKKQALAMHKIKMHRKPVPVGA